MDSQKFVVQGLVDFFSSLSKCSPLSGALLDKDQQFYFSGIHFVSGSGVFDLPFFSKISHEKVVTLLEIFQRKKVPFIWWGGSEKLNAFGFQKGGEMTGIYAQVPDQVPFSSNLVIKRAVSLEQLALFSRIMGEVFGMDLQIQEQLKQVHFAASEKGENYHYIAYENEAPVCIATLSITGGTAGIWNLATIPSARGKGLASAVICSILQELKDRKIQEVMALLLPDGQARKAFEKIGFKEVIKIPFYIHPKHLATLSS